MSSCDPTCSCEHLHHVLTCLHPFTPPDTHPNPRSYTPRNYTLLISGKQLRSHPRRPVASPDPEPVLLRPLEMPVLKDLYTLCKVLQLTLRLNFSTKPHTISHLKHWIIHCGFLTFYLLDVKFFFEVTKATVWCWAVRQEGGAVRRCWESWEAMKWSQQQDATWGPWVGADSSVEDTAAVAESGSHEWRGKENRFNEDKPSSFVHFLWGLFISWRIFGHNPTAKSILKVRPKFFKKWLWMNMIEKRLSMKYSIFLWFLYI